MVDIARMEQPPLEYIHPSISEVQVNKVTHGMRTISFTMTTAGEKHSITMWNPQLVHPDETELQPLSEAQLLDCFTDCDICSVFQMDTNRARMEFQKNDDHPIVKASRIQFEA